MVRSLITTRVCLLLVYDCDGPSRRGRFRASKACRSCISSTARELEDAPWCRASGVLEIERLLTREPPYVRVRSGRNRKHPCMTHRWVTHVQSYPCITADSSIINAIFPFVQRKNPHAVALGRLGGQKTAEVRSEEERREIGHRAGKVGGRARAEKLSSKRRSDIARQAAAARWAKVKKESS
jgi:hypothetical protein